MFAYSPREGTPAFGEKESLCSGEKKARLQKLIEIQNQITIQKVQDMVGRTEEILLEGPSRQSKQEWIGKTGCFKKVVVPYQPGMKPGMLVKVSLEERRGITLAGSLAP
jgi:tRNA-2-methylthio-N6-dimethylallyladenosine synthase